MELHLTVTGCHSPYGITQCYLPPDTSEQTPPQPQPDRPVLDLPTPEGFPSLFTFVVPTPVKTILKLSRPAFRVLPKTGDEELEDRGKPG